MWSLAVDTTLPEGDSATLRLTTSSSRRFTLALRRPGWPDGFAVSVNGEAVTDLPRPQSYVELTRTWRTGDVVEVSLRKELRRERCRTIPAAAILWGPLCSPAMSARKTSSRRGSRASSRRSWPRSGRRPTASTGARSAGVLSERRRRPADGRRLRAVLPLAPPHLLGLLRPLHPLGMGEQVAADAAESKRQHTAGPCLGRDHPAGGGGVGRGVRPAGRGDVVRSGPGSLLPPQQEVVLLRRAGRARSAHGAGRDVLPRREWRDRTFAILVDDQEGRAEDRARRRPALLRRGVRGAGGRGRRQDRP